MMSFSNGFPISEKFVIFVNNSKTKTAQTVPLGGSHYSISNLYQQDILLQIITEHF